MAELRPQEPLPSPDCPDPDLPLQSSFLEATPGLWRVCFLGSLDLPENTPFPKTS